MFDQLIIGEKASLDDFDASISIRQIGEPTKKKIKDTVPFSNITHDFSKINGELYWNERELEYEFEIIADTPEELERKKTAFKNWVMNVMEEKLYDPYIPDYHFLATFDDIDPADDESLEKTTITVKFTAYPYQIANDPTVYDFIIPAATEKKITVVNGGIHRVTPTIKFDTSLIWKIVEDIKLKTYAKTGYYSAVDGKWCNATNPIQVTDLIAVSAGDKFIVTGCTTLGTALVCWYTENGVFISSVKGATGSNEIMSITVEAPEKAAYAVFQSKIDVTLEAVKRVEKARYSMTAGEITDETFDLSVGGNTFVVENTNDTDCNLTVKFNEEVF